MKAEIHCPMCSAKTNIQTKFCPSEKHYLTIQFCEICDSPFIISATKVNNIKKIDAAKIGVFYPAYEGGKE